MVLERQLVFEEKSYTSAKYVDFRHMLTIYNSISTTRGGVGEEGFREPNSCPLQCLCVMESSVRSDLEGY